MTKVFEFQLECEKKYHSKTLYNACMDVFEIVHTEIFSYEIIIYQLFVNMKYKEVVSNSFVNFLEKNFSF